MKAFEEMRPGWIERLEIAFQPIVNIHTGRLYGVEALLRGVENIGFGSIAEFFDRVYRDNLLYSLDLALREKVFAKFVRIDGYEQIKLFINLDNRLLEMPDFSSGNTERLLKRYGVEREMVCFEISERYDIGDAALLEEILTHYRKEQYCIAVDDFGVGYSGYKMLYRSTPDIIKIDRFFLGAICRDLRKKILVRSIVHLATQLGITVIAEGVETETEMLVCKELGCHLMQGYFVQRPTLDTGELCPKYRHIRRVNRRDRRGSESKEQLLSHVERIPPVRIDDTMEEVLARYRDHTHEVLPVIGRDGVPLGIIDDAKIWELIVSPYGRSVLLNASSKKTPKLKKYLQKCAMADIHTGVEQLVECFANHKEGKGIVITRNMTYQGFLKASEIVALVNARNLASARDQNPLTRLPGNQRIDRYITEVLEEGSGAMMCYFDLNHFKAYNDQYGFRNGDRVIQLFADLMNKELPRIAFKGHVGGDDFFAGISLEEEDFESGITHVRRLAERFGETVLQLYDSDDRERGWLVGRDRHGNMETFPLLKVSTSVVVVAPGIRNRSAGVVHRHFALLKSAAKRAPEYLSGCSII